MRTGHRSAVCLSTMKSEESGAASTTSGGASSRQPAAAGFSLVASVMTRCQTTPWTGGSAAGSRLGESSCDCHEVDGSQRISDERTGAFEFTHSLLFHSQSCAVKVWWPSCSQD